MLKPIRALATNATAAAYALAAGAIIRIGAFAANVGEVSLEDAWGVEIYPLAVGADGVTLSINVWEKIANVDVPGEYMLNYLGEITATACTQLGPTGGTLQTATERCCDTVTWTASSSTSGTILGGMTEHAEVFGTHVGREVSNASNQPGRVIIAATAGRGKGGALVLDFKVGTATSANAIVRPLK